MARLVLEDLSTWSSSADPRAVAAELAEGTAGPPTLCHGNASLQNVFSSPSGEIAFVDWEDVRRGAGVADLAWLLVSSVAPTESDDVIGAYGPTPRLNDLPPAAAAQGLLSLADVADGSPDAAGWVDRQAATSRRLPGQQPWHAVNPEPSANLLLHCLPL